MGRVILFLLIVVTAVALWKAFGPGSNGAAKPKITRRQPEQVTAKGPDDDPDFLWNIEKERFKQRREQERQAEIAAEQAERERRRRQLQSDDDSADQGKQDGKSADGCTDSDGDSNTQPSGN